MAHTHFLKDSIEELIAKLEGDKNLLEAARRYAFDYYMDDVRESVPDIIYNGLDQDFIPINRMTTAQLIMIPLGIEASCLCEDPEEENLKEYEILLLSYPQELQTDLDEH